MNQTLSDLLHQKNSFRGYTDGLEQRLSTHVKNIKRIQLGMSELSKELQEESDAYRRELAVVKALKDIGNTPILDKADIFLEESFLVGDFVRRPDYDLSGESYEIVEVIDVYPHIYRLNGTGGLWAHNELLLVQSKEVTDGDEVSES